MGHLQRGNGRGGPAISTPAAPAAYKVLRSKLLVPGRALPEEPNAIIRGEMEGGDCPAGRGRRDSPCGEGIQVSGVKPTLSNTAAASSVER